MIFSQNREKELKMTIHIVPIVKKKFTIWNMPNMGFLDHLNTLVFSDVIKTKICVNPTYSAHNKKTRI